MEKLGLDKDTYVIYTSDHGEMMGNHGLWFKNCMLEDSVGIPMILSGPDIPRGKVNKTHVSLVDLFPTILDMMGVVAEEDGRDRRGLSLYRLACSGETADRAVFFEFHASASYTGGFMVRYQDYKYIYYVGYLPQLFDLKTDPREMNDLAPDPSHAEVCAVMKRKLEEFGCSEEIDRVCRKDQEERLNRHGGKEHILKTFVPIIFSPPPVK